MDEKEIIQAAAEGAAKGLGGQIPPLYPDIVQPAAKQVGKALGTIAGLINVALAPVAAVVWGYDKVSDYLTQTLSEKLSDVLPENIITPPASIVGPSIEAIKFLANEADLRELYAQLIATSINSETTENAHPGFVEIIKNLSSDDAKILNYIYRKQYFACIFLYGKRKSTGTKLRIDYFLSTYEIEYEKPLKLGGLNLINNLDRLGLISTPEDLLLKDSAEYELIEKLPTYETLYNGLKKDIDIEITAEKQFLILTPLGRQFCETCISK
ncbi:hypothetical protein BEL04_04170 [Mucilaginibacter sp. PPCGB 2223]|uniref:DUF4393 domain-containing protein n=1 Tax=Mucilaginibacter sp. PPCGB 2223 TaxID=1886027 RepID=UPI0008261C08|nr:DUF4393 domain-containing protein [Mucilaginibacter sp. PPCGB 2223]OCX53503.1 hypothetical protein BEL04_04170 [Mucilaginibacter sp. PPCGB 2223]